MGHPSRTLEGNSRKRSESVSGVFPEFFRNFFRKVPAVLGVWPIKRQFHRNREAPVRFGSVTVWRWNGSSGSGFRFRRFLCKMGFSVFQHSLTGKDGSGSGFGSWKTVSGKFRFRFRFREKRFRRFRFPVPVRFLSHPELCFTLLHNFSHFFIIFPPGLSPSKQRVLAQGEQKRRKDNKKRRANRFCTLVVARLSSSYKMGGKNSRKIGSGIVNLLLRSNFSMAGSFGLVVQCQTHAVPPCTIPLLV